MLPVVQELRNACSVVAARARHVTIDLDAIDAYAAGLPLPEGAADALDAAAGDPAGAPTDDAAGDDASPGGDREQRAAFWLALDAVNFGSGWFPTLRKPPGRSGYQTISSALRARAQRAGPWTAGELSQLDARTVAGVLDQDPGHELMDLYAQSLRDLGEHVSAEHDHSFAAVVDDASGSAVALARRLGGWRCFSDCSRYEDVVLAFLKRAQIAAADLDRAGVARFGDLDRLTMFADNLVPHVLRLDGILSFDPGLVERIDNGELIGHDSPAEIEIRACSVHAVELIVGARPGTSAARVDQLLWQRGQQPRYKASPRHRSRCTAY
jgi:hypothetical protein